MTEPVFASIVIGTDGSQTAETALRAAVDLACECAARLQIVSAYEPDPGERLNGAITYAQSSAGARGDVRAVLDHARELARRDGVGQVDTFACEGDAADAILDVAEQQSADLIVVGNKGLTAAGRLLLGSVPNEVSQRARCSVLIVRTT